MLSFHIRPARESDAAQLAELVREIRLFSQINSESPADTNQHVTRDLSLCLNNDGHNLYVAEDSQGKIQGYLSVHWLPYLIHRDLEGYISELFIRDAARGQGIGTALLDTAVTEARRRGCGRMTLVNMRHRESYQRKFYKKHGWEEREDAANLVLAL